MDCLVLFTVLLSRLIQLHAEQESINTDCPRGLFLSEQHTCLPCNCKGHAHSCEDITGICIDCQDHSTGDFCEQCEDGYVLEETSDGRHECRPCACPIATTSNNFATYCHVRRTSVRCVCQDGYAGNYCERCAPGFFGNPMRLGDSCKKCNCNGNSDPNLIINECHNVTGRCLQCYGDTAGNNCERCAPGYYGDAITAKNCRKCECNKCGTASCDDRSGVCHCKPGVTGRLCDQCEEGYSGFSNCMGCRRCDCAAAALYPSCNTLTHVCQCRAGAGGRYCERCLPGFWDYSPTGCKKCDCPSENCDVHTGECLPEMSQISECSTDCDECIWHLMGDVRKSNKTVEQLTNSILNISTGAAAHDRLKYYNYTVHTLRIQFTGWRNKSELMRKQTGDMEKQMTHLNQPNLQERYLQDYQTGQQVDAETQQSFNLTKVLTANLTALNVLIKEMIDDWERYSMQQEVDPEVEEQKKTEAEKMISTMRALDFSSIQPLATQENIHANQLLLRVHQMEKSVSLMEGRVPQIREVMNLYSSKLQHSKSHLTTAEDLMQQTLNSHSQSQLRLQRRGVQQQRLRENYDNVNSTLLQSQDIVTKSSLLVETLTDMVTKLREYHAKLDGATVSVQQKIDQLSKADKDLVQRASDHAQELQTDADELQHNLKGSETNGFVQKALDASNVYNNIVKYINKAENSSRFTQDMSSRTKDAVEGIISQLNFLKTRSDHMLKESVTRKSELEEVKAAVIDTQNYIKENNAIKQTSVNTLVGIVDNIHKIQRAPNLQSTQDVAVVALNYSVEVLEEVTPISKQVEKWNTNMKNNQYSTVAYEQAVNSAQNTVEELSGIVPQLLTKLQDVEEKRPSNNVSTNIMRIRELIAQARSVANKVQVSMKFDGQLSVELHPPAKVDELKPMTSISLYVRVDPDTDPIEDRFLLYLGDKSGQKDYMGLAIKNDNLVFVYKLGGDDVEIPLGSKPVSSWPAVFNHIKVERLGRHGKVFLTVPSQESVAEQKFIQKGESIGTDSLLHLDHKDTVFIIGRAPDDVKLPPVLSLAPFVGCIELATINNEVISLYNFKRLHNMQVDKSKPCPRYKLAFTQGRVASYLFDGSGYALIKNIERRGKMGIVTRFDIEVRTVANNGVLLLMDNKENFFVLELKNGFLRLVYDFGFAAGPVVMESNTSKVQINDAKYHEVSVIYHQMKKVILLVDRLSIKMIENEKKTLPFKDIYIGGAPSAVLQSRPEFSSLVGLKGCVKGFQFQKYNFNLLEEPGTIGISSGCLEESFMSRKAYFTGTGYLSSTAKISPFSLFEGGMNFKTLQPSGLLFYHKHETDVFSLSLENGAVVLHSKENKIKSHRKNYNDGRPHYLVISVTKQKYQLVIDDKDKQDRKNLEASVSTGLQQFYYGGSPHSSINNFTGCISYAYISKQDRDVEAEDFQRYSEKVQVSLQDCPVERNAFNFRTTHTRSTRHTVAPVNQVSRNKPGPPQGIVQLQNDTMVSQEMLCHRQRPRAVRHSHYYSGSSHSRREYNAVAAVIAERSHFSMSVRTRSVSGLIASLYNKDDESFMALYLFNGKLTYTFGSGRNILQLQTKHAYNDGRWHDVVFIRERNSGKLIVDGMFVMEEKIHSIFTLKLQDPLYVGGVSPEHPHKHIQVSGSFSGCIRDLRLNGHLIASSPRSFGVTACYEERSESGVYFSEEGGYILLEDSFDLGEHYEFVMEVRPRVASAVLLHAHTLTKRLTVYLQQGQVFVELNNRILSTNMLLRSSICDGTWHNIKVMTDGKQLSLEVNGKVIHMTGLDDQDTKSAKAQLFIGGTPDSVPSLGKSSYTGCLRNVIVNKLPVNFSNSIFVSGAVNVRACPAA